MLEALKHWVTLKLAGTISSNVEDRWKWLPTQKMFDPRWEKAFTPDGSIKETSSVMQSIAEPVPYAYSVPLLSDHYCDWLIDKAEQCNKWSYDKKDDYGAWEMNLTKLTHGVDTYHRQVVIGDFLTPLFVGLYQWRPSKVSRIFLVKYAPGNFPEMESHWDGESILSVSINLSNPTDYKGGWLSFLRTPHIEIREPRGHALMFAGNPVMSHKAHAVTEGTRYVLVYWLR